MNIKSNSGHRDVQVFCGQSVSIEFSRWGEGYPIVLLPGLGGSSDQFSEFAPRLADAGYSVLAPNPRGVGQSVGSMVNLTLHDYARDVAHLIEHCGYSSANVLGRAFGNRWARCFAADFPERVRGLILVSAGGMVPADQEAQAAFQRMFAPGLTEVERHEACRAALFSPASKSKNIPMWRAWPEAVKAQHAAISATPVEDWWSGGSSPMLVVQGLDDRIAPPGNGHLLQEKFPSRVTLVDIPDAGHAVLFEQTDQVIESIVKFLGDFDRS